MAERQQQQIVDEEDGTLSCCAPVPGISELTKPVHVDRYGR